MSPRLRQVNPKECIRAFEQLGFIIRRQTGSHCIMRHPERKRIVSIPVHAGDIKRGLLFGLLRQSGISQKDFFNVL